MQLICHGTCNPHRHAIDRDVSEERRRLTGHVNIGGATIPVSDELAARLRTLHHTRHRPIETPGPLQAYACDDCNTVRTCGNKLNTPKVD